MRTLTYAVPPEAAGRLLGTVLRREMHLSAGLLKKLKYLQDAILVDGRRALLDYRLSPGEAVTVRFPEEENRLVPTPFPLRVLYEDEDLLVLSKPAGFAVHPRPGERTDTIGNFVTDYYKKHDEAHLFRPVNRLDRGTSGLMAVAKSAYVHALLMAALHTRDFVRTYLAVTEGQLAAERGFLDAPVGRAEGSVIRREVRPDGRPAVTRWEVVRYGNGRTLVRLSPETGRTHQLRVHMAYLGHPLTGDFLYGTEDKTLIARPALHSAEMSLTQPVTGKRLHLEAPLPADMARLLEG
ncbi:MAG TPA: RluA family pseudouridine synthase [Oscillospiraceae bacterium]|nr:RluA family pseudouridine synthase [Oscillospiraceae bacterium]